MTISVLWLGRIIPLPLSAGDRVYSLGLCTALARAGARVAFLGLANPDEAADDDRALDPAVTWRQVPGPPRSRLRSVLSREPLVGARFATREYKKAIARELAANRFDAVIFDQYGMGWALPVVRRLARNRPTLAHVCHNFETDVTAAIARNFRGRPWHKLALLQNAGKARRVERMLAEHCDVAVALTESDRLAFTGMNSRLKAIILPPGYDGRRKKSRVITGATPRRAMIVGSFRWIAKQMNLEYFLQIAGASFARHQIELHVVGLVPDELRRRLQAQFPHVVFRGFVDDLQTEFDNARVALVPEETGGGFKLKILDYVFGRVPVASVGSALSGIPEPLKSQFLVAENLGELAARVVACIDDVERLNLMQQRAFALAEGAFNWERNGVRLLDVLDRSPRSSPSAEDKPVKKPEASHVALDSVSSAR